jgi:hypothetical protein
MRESDGDCDPDSDNAFPSALSGSQIKATGFAGGYSLPAGEALISRGRAYSKRAREARLGASFFHLFRITLYAYHNYQKHAIVPIADCGFWITGYEEPLKH